MSKEDILINYKVQREELDYCLEKGIKYKGVKLNEKKYKEIRNIIPT